MECDVYLCLYNLNDSCLLKKTTINFLGMCEECMLVNIPNTVLDSLKEEQLEEILNRKIGNKL